MYRIFCFTIILQFVFSLGARAESPCVSPDIDDQNKILPLLEMIRRGDEQFALQTIDGLSDAELRLGYRENINSDVVTPLFGAIKADSQAIVSALLMRGVAPDDAGVRYIGRPLVTSPLSYAVANKHTAMAQLLIAQGASLTSLCDTDRDAVEQAAFYADDQIVLQLIGDYQMRTPKALLALIEGIEADAIGGANRRQRVEKILPALLANNFNPDDEIAEQSVIKLVTLNEPVLLEALLVAQVNVNLRNPAIAAGPTLLMEAALRGHLELINVFARHSPDYSLTDSWSNTALHYAAAGGELEIARIIFTSGVLPTANSTGYTPIMMALTSEMINLLVKFGDSVDARDSSQNTVLINSLTPAIRLPHSEASKQRDVVALSRQLILQRANVNALLPNGNNALMYVGRSNLAGRIAAAELLINSGTDLNHVNDVGDYAIHMFADTASLSVINKMLSANVINVTDKFGRTALFRLISSGKVTIADKEVGLNRLLSFGANPTLTENNGSTLLHYTVNRKEFDNETGVRILQSLLTAGTDPNIGDTSAKTPLMLAIQRASPILAEQLIQFSNLDMRDSERRSTLHYIADHRIPLFSQPSAQLKTKLRKLFNMLVKHGADINALDTNLETPLMYAAKNDRDILVRHILEQVGSRVDLQNQSGETALIVAMKKNHHRIAFLLANLGADQCLRDTDGLRAVHYSKPDVQCDYTGFVFDRHNGSIPRDMIVYRRVDPPFPAPPPRIIIDGRLGKIGIPDDTKMITVRAPVVANSSYLYCNDILFEAAKAISYEDFYKASNEKAVDSPLDDALDDLRRLRGPILSGTIKRGEINKVLQVLPAPLNAICNGKSAYVHAAYHGVNEVLSTWAIWEHDITLLDKDNWTASNVAKRNRQQPSVNVITEWADKVLARLKIPLNGVQFHSAISDSYRSDVGTGKALLFVESSIDKNTRRGTGTTPLMLAAEKGSVVIAKNLLGRGANPNLYDAQKFTALMWAAKFNQLPVAKLLVENKADIHAKNQIGQNARDIAQQEGYTDFVNWISGQY